MKKRFVQLARVGTVLALLVVVIGAWVRLTDAGLGCPDWPGCYGQLVVTESTRQAAEAFPQRPLDVGKAWREMIHRYLASGLGLLCLAMAGLAWFNRRDPQQPTRLAWVLLGVVIFQGLLGMWTVTLLLKPAIVLAHLLGGLATLGLLFWLGEWRPRHAPGGDAPAEDPSAGKAFRGGALRDDASAGKAFRDGAPVGDASAGEAFRGGAPVGDASAGEAFRGDAPVGNPFRRGAPRGDDALRDGDAFQEGVSRDDALRDDAPADGALRGGALRDGDAFQEGVRRDDVLRGDAPADGALRDDARRPGREVRAASPWLARAGLAALVVLVAQIALGGWTSANYAALACPDFPTCQTRWWPPVADFREGFVLWRELGVDYEGGVLDNPARVAIHFSHRLGAVLAALMLGLLGWLMIRRTGLRPDGLAVLGALGLQLILGASIVIHGVPLIVAVAHNGVAALLFLAVLNANQGIRYQR